MKWQAFLEQEMHESYFECIRNAICADILAGYTICPAFHDMFRIFDAVAYEDIRVVILGQDPYYAKVDEANGFAFAVGANVVTPPSLKNIFKEIADEYGKEPEDKTLEYLVKQGVFLLNTALTTRHGEAFIHGNLWQPFTDKVISCLNARERPIVFLLWGSKAIAKKAMITNSWHYILESVHPSPLSAYRGFLGCKHFCETNRILRELGEKEIDWVGY